MKAALFCIVFCIAIAVPAWGISCRTEPERCKKDECCVEFGIFGRCRPLKAPGEKCEIKSIMDGKDKHMYALMCPCVEGYECTKNEVMGTLQGTCEAKSGSRK
uniref:U62-Liphistoxin-Lsp1b_1 n=1 Tax=Liphistius sp. SGP-2016 TaxID=1905180 RepID=A0A4Q8K6C2_9ARAC